MEETDEPAPPPSRKNKEKKSKKETQSTETKKQKKKKEEEALQKIQKQLEEAENVTDDIPSDALSQGSGAMDEEDWVVTDIDLQESKVVIHVLAGEFEFWRQPPNGTATPRSARERATPHPGALPMPTEPNAFSRGVFEHLTVTYLPPPPLLNEHRDCLYQEADVRIGIESLDILELSPILEKV